MGPRKLDLLHKWISGVKYNAINMVSVRLFNSLVMKMRYLGKSVFKGAKKEAGERKEQKDDDFHEVMY